MKQLIVKIFVGLLLLSYVIFPVTSHASHLPKVTVTTSFIADMVNQLAGDSVQIHTLIPAGSDPHLYSANAQDLNALLQADLILYSGLHLEAKLASILEEHGHAITDSIPRDQLLADPENSNAYDPHFWFDIDLYKIAVTHTASLLIQEFPSLKQLVSDNLTAYLHELDDLKAWVMSTITAIDPASRLLVTPHDAFGYFARMTQFTVYSPQGISTESEVSNQEIRELVDFLVSQKVNAIFLDTTSNPQALEKIRESVLVQGRELKLVGGPGQELYSDSLAPKGQENDTYLAMYRHNVSLIVSHLK